MNNSTLPPLSEQSRIELVKLLNSLADISADTIMPFFRSDLEVQDKAAPGSFDPVTLADQNAEQAIRDKIGKHFPDHGIIGEEFDDKPAENTINGEYHWVIDPIDGTRGFMSGFPTWGTLIGLLQNSAPLMGMMNQPFTKERYWSDSQKSYYAGPDKKHELRTRKCSDIESAIMSSTDPAMFKTPEDIAAFSKIHQQARLTRYSGDCYSYCLLAAGHIDLVMERGLKIYDIAPLIPIIENAGGVVTCWDGTEATNGGKIIAAGDPTLHEKVLSEINN
ncbi:MAG: histidinol-phosphatase [Methyloligellaceae bacterium]